MTHRSNITVLVFLLLGLWLQLEVARGESSDLIATAYEVRIASLPALRIKYSVRISSDSYRSEVSIKTKGMVSLLSDYRMDMVASGRFMEGEAKYISFASTTEKKKKRKQVSLKWQANGPPIGGVADEDPRTQAEIEAALAPTVSDPLTAVIQLGASTMEKPCQATQRVFSGREVFDLIFTLEREVTLDSDSPGVYRGRAYQCRMIYAPIAGRSATKFRKRNAEPLEFKVWLALVRSKVLDRSILVPVLASGRLDGQKFVAFASSATIAGRSFNKLSLAQ
jgi:Protein of unknown function (DUF3108)